ncbi:MAG: hypothetical protein DWP92_01265 [Armatimonadetes bacterium]|nr:MAG: hypothetical protein DWP92_01265 [Armatimonadota bacterium]
MDIDSVVAEFKAVVHGQLRLAANDEAVEAAGEAILAALEPALRQAGSSLAEQAAVEVGSQLPDRAVEVILRDGQPTLRVQQANDPISINADDLGARMTVRLPHGLKVDLESAAAEAGDSVNTFVVRALAGKANRTKTSTSSRFDGTIET